MNSSGVKFYNITICQEIPSFPGNDAMDHFFQAAKEEEDEEMAKAKPKKCLRLGSAV